MSPTEDSKGEQEVPETEAGDPIENETESEEGEPKPISGWLWLALVVVLGGIVFLLVFNFLHRSPAP